MISLLGGCINRLKHGVNSPSDLPTQRRLQASSYEPFIEGIRGLLAGYVVLFHLVTVIGYVFNEGDPLDARGWLDWAFYGHYAVVAFIFISGLCLGIPVVRNREAGRPLLPRGALGFYRARARRILPAYYASLVLSTAVAVLLQRLGYSFPSTYFLPVRAEAIVGSMLLVPNLVNNHNGSGVIWSLGVELQIYLVFPVICTVWRRVGVVGVFCVAAAAASCAQAYLPHIIHLSGIDITIIGGTVSGLCPTLYVVFALGLVAANLFFSDGELARKIRSQLPWGLLLVTFILVLYTRALRWGLVGDPQDYLVGLFMFLLTLAVGRHARLRWVLERPVPVQLGTLSYSLYLTHLPLINLIFLLVYKRLWPTGMQGNFVRAFAFHIGVGLPLMVGFAWLFARLFEWPFMNSRARRAAAAHYRPPSELTSPEASINVLPARQED